MHLLDLYEGQISTFVHKGWKEHSEQNISFRISYFYGQI